MNKVLYYFFFAVLIGLAINTTSCKKPLVYSAANLTFSADTLVFDTVFTTVGSTTKQFKLYNPENRTVVIEQIELMGGTNSPYRINVDGLTGTHFGNLELDGKDSLFVFVEVTLDPNNGTNPLIIEDSIRFRTNGSDQYVHLAAWGQDAYFYNKETISGILPNDKPHVIYNYAAVDSAESLIVQPGTHFYLHKNSSLIVYKGSIDIQGTSTDPVTFQGDRLEQDYDDVSGAYFGLYFFEAKSSKINYAVIRNGTSGVHLFGADPSNAGYTVEMTNTIVQNCASYGLAIFDQAKVKAENCIFAKSGSNQLNVGMGDFNLNHCHFVGYGNGENPGAAVGIRNTYINNGTQYIGPINEGTITNSVIYGNNDYEFAIDTTTGAPITMNFQYNLIKSSDVLTGPEFSNNLWNLSPSFVNASESDFTYYSNSNLIDAGNLLFPNTIPEAVNVDILGNARPAGMAPDIGAYELF